MDIPYTASYCEENIYHLAKKLPADGLYVVFVSNACKKVLFWLNKARISQERPDGLVVWDYHVILVSILNGAIYDYDSAVSFPCQTQHYLRHVLRVDVSHCYPEEFQRLYRVIHARDYISGFASDRSHMLLNGEYMAPPPQTECIKGPNGTVMNLTSLFAMQIEDVSSHNDIAPGVLGNVMNEFMFCQWLQSSS